jgi:peroxiredoxin (alkyl hydroperoxide reductase subunit C)
LRDIERIFGVKVDFPLIEDPSMAIARAYGMLDSAAPSSATVRATYVIDPEGVIRAIVWYPMNVGRSVDELLRLVEALQASQRTGASTPEGWRFGDPLLEQPATTMDEAEATNGSTGAWYFRERVA